MSGLLSYRIYTCLLAAACLGLKPKRTVNQSKQGIITAASNIYTGMNLGSALLEKDVAGLNELTVCSLGAETLGLGISAVLGGADTLLMSEQLKVHSQHDSFTSLIE
jgi:hypothetical protein